MRKLRLGRGNDTSKDMGLFSDQAGVGTWVFQVSNVPPGCHGLSCVGLVLPSPRGLETGQERSQVRRKAEGCGALRTHWLTCLERGDLQGLGQVGSEQQAQPPRGPAWG